MAQLSSSLPVTSTAIMSAQVDMHFLGVTMTTQRLEAQGIDRTFYDTHGYYIDPVSDQTAVLPIDWESQQKRYKIPSLGGQR